MSNNSVAIQPPLPWFPAASHFPRKLKAVFPTYGWVEPVQLFFIRKEGLSKD